MLAEGLSITPDTSADTYIMINKRINIRPESIIMIEKKKLYL